MIGSEISNGKKEVVKRKSPSAILDSFDQALARVEPTINKELLANKKPCVEAELTLKDISDMLSSMDPISYALGSPNRAALLNLWTQTTTMLYGEEAAKICMRKLLDSAVEKHRQASLPMGLPPRGLSALGIIPSGFPMQPNLFEVPNLFSASAVGSAVAPSMFGTLPTFRHSSR